IFFKNSSGSYYHTGIVVEYLPSEGAIRTIEGNSSDAVKMNYYKLNKTIIDGYGAN
ncbi:MAG TPA: CHAP domain-containing protein, partial [Clostridium sp.]|nr:CHAP domain-containing protein [Clostridium sp.]